MASTSDIGGLTVEYDETVLEPRPWTAAQARWAADVATDLPGGALLELCAGAGHIGLLTAVLTGRDAVLVDASDAACRFAERNAEQVRAAGPAVEVRHGPMADVLHVDERFPLVLADPPYIPTVDVSTFPADPRPAIDGGTDGLDVVRACLALGARHLAKDGAMVLQVRDTAQAAGLADDAVAVGLRVEDVRDVESRGALVLLAAADPPGRA